MLDELQSKIEGYNITIKESDLLEFDHVVNKQAELITCMGDTITHLYDKREIQELLDKVNCKLIASGKVAISYRDLSIPLIDENRFIPVKSD